MTKLPAFLTEWRGVLFFLSAVFIFALVFVLVYNPLNPPPNLDGQLYTGVLVASGFVVLLISRIMMHLLSRRHTILWRHFILWAGGEWLLFVFGLALFAYLIYPGQSFFAIVGRVSLDVAAILVVPYTVTLLLFLLDEKNTQVELLREELEKLRQETAQPPESVNFCDRAGRIAFATRRSNILYIEAADNYCIIHYLAEGREESFMLNNTMKYFDSGESNNHTSSHDIVSEPSYNNNPSNWMGTESEAKHSTANLGLLRCHRSYLVNMENVRLLRKEKDSLILELVGDHTIPVSRSYKDRVVNAFSLIQANDV